MLVERLAQPATDKFIARFGDEMIDRGGRGRLEAVRSTIKPFELERPRPYLGLDRGLYWGLLRGLQPELLRASRRAILKLNRCFLQRRFP